MNEFINREELSKCVLTKEQMWKALNGKTVKCITVENEGIQLSAVQDIENNKIYLLDRTANCSNEK